MGLRRSVARSLALYRWKAESFALPAPHFVKQSVLERHGIPRAPWIETGTYRGSTTAFLSASKVLKPPLVISIELSEVLYRAASEKLGHLAGIKLVCGSSEDALEVQLCSLESTSVNLWLDGHYSGGQTALVGGNETPIEHELNVIQDVAQRFDKVAVFVDDTRLFGNSLSLQPGYPQLSLLPQWADRLRLRWHFGHDVFVARGTPHA